MDYRGPDLKADLKTIWDLATQGFPRMAKSYRSANVAVHLTYTNSGGYDARFLENWRSFRDQCEMVLGQDARTLGDTAVALSQAVVGYAGEDTEAAEAVSQAGIDLDEEVPTIEPPLYPVAFQPAGGPESAPPSRPEYTYVSDAPTKEALAEKAQIVDDKLYEAAYAELNMLLQAATSISELVGIDTVGGDGYVFTVDKIKAIALDNPASYQGAIGSLESVVIDDENGPFGRFMTEVNHASRALDPDKWDSEAARAFAENFIDTYEDTVEAQRAMLGSLHGAVLGYQTALADTYKAYDQIMDETINACNAVIQSEGARKLQLTLAALVAVVTEVVSTSGKGALLFALVGKGIELLSSNVQVGEVTWDGKSDVSGDSSGTPRTALIRYSLFAAVDKAHGRLIDFDNLLTQGMRADYETVLNGRSDPSLRLQLARPELADNPAAL